jgi:hypothetical protein
MTGPRVIDDAHAPRSLYRLTRQLSVSASLCSSVSVSVGCRSYWCNTAASSSVFTSSCGTVPKGGNHPRTVRDQTRRAHSTPLRYAETAWLRGSCAPGVPERPHSGPAAVKAGRSTAEAFARSAKADERKKWLAGELVALRVPDLGRLETSQTSTVAQACER